MQYQDRDGFACLPPTISSLRAGGCTPLGQFVFNLNKLNYMKIAIIRQIELSEMESQCRLMPKLHSAITPLILDRFEQKPIRFLFYQARSNFGAVTFRYYIFEFPNFCSDVTKAIITTLSPCISPFNNFHWNKGIRARFYKISSLFNRSARNLAQRSGVTSEEKPCEEFGQNCLKLVQVDQTWELPLWPQHQVYEHEIRHTY